MRIILFRGLPGVGKTYVSDVLALKINSLILRKDNLYDVIADDINNHEKSSKL